VLIDALVAMEKAMKRDKIDVNDRQLACARIDSEEGKDYLKGMAAAANYAWVNRSSMTFLCRQVKCLVTCAFHRNGCPVAFVALCLSKAANALCLQVVNPSILPPGFVSTIS